MISVSVFASFAQSTTPEQILYGYGPLGIGVVALAIIGYKMFNIILRDRDAAIAQRDSLIEDVFTKVLPAITRNTDVLEKRQDLDKALIQTVQDSNKIIEANGKALDEVKYALKHGGNSSVGGT